MYMGFLEYGGSLDVPLSYYLGAELQDSILNYQSRFEQSSPTEKMVTLMGRALWLRDTLHKQLSAKDVGVYYLLIDRLPGFVLYEVSDAHEACLSLDFRAFSAKVRSGSPSDCDHLLLATWLEAYPFDSTEYFTAAWNLEVDQKQVYSLMGEGRFLSFLSSLDGLLPCGHEYRSAIDELKGRLVNDMVKPNVLYWRPREEVLAELAQIKQADFGCLTSPEKAAIENCLEVLSLDSLKFDYRSGLPR